MAINSVNNNNNVAVNNNNNDQNNVAKSQGTLAGLCVKKASVQQNTGPLNLSRSIQAALTQKATATPANNVKASSASSTSASKPSTSVTATAAPKIANPTRPTIAVGATRTAIGTNSSLRNTLQNILNIPSNAVQAGNTRSKISMAGQTQNVTVNFNRGGSVTQFNNNGSFPPSSTATLPRNVFDQQGILSFYQTAGPLSATQLKAVQNAYAGPNNISSRLNYATNIANLAKNLTQIKNSPGTDDATRAQIKQTLGNLRTAYNTLSDVNAAAPDPRALYAGVAKTYASLSTNGNLSSDQQAKVSNGLNILGISAANYDTNRLPVPGAKPATPAAPTAAQQAANQAAAAKFPLPAFDTVRKQPLADAQANPANVFGSQVSSFLQSIGVNGVDPSNITYQVNSANQLQSIQLQTQDGRRLTALFNMGMIDKNNAQFVKQPSNNF